MCCPKCGAEIDAGQKFCTKCGQTLESTDSASQSMNTPSEAKAKKTFPALTLFKNKKVWIPLCVAALVIVGVLFCVFHTPLPSRNRVQSDLSEYLARSEMQSDTFAIKKLTIDSKQLDGDKRFLSIICTATLENDCVRRYQSYQLSYQRWNSNSWSIFDITPYNYDHWSSEPVSGVTEQYILEKLYGQKVIINDSEVVLDETNLKAVTINSQSTDLEKGIDEVQITYRIESGIASCEQDADLRFQFTQSDWTLTDLTNTNEAEVSYSDGHAFDRTDDQIKSDIYTTPIVWKGNYGTQNISIDETTMSNFAVKGQNFEWSSGQVTVACAFTVVKRVATLQVDADVIYTNTASGWNVSAINYTPVVESISLKGDWVGYYSAWGEKPSLSLSVTSHDANNMLAATFTFGPSANAPDYESGSFSMVGGVEKDTLTVNLKRNEWIDRPGSYSMVDLYGMLWIDDERIADKNSGFEITLKQNDEG